MSDTPNPMNPYGGRGDDEGDNASGSNNSGSHNGGFGGSGFGSTGPGGAGGDGLEEMLRGLMGGQAPDPQMLDALRGMGLGQMDPATMGMMQAQFQAMMSGNSGAAFNEQLAKDVARRVVAAQGDPSIPATTKTDMTQVVQVADLWLDQVTDFTAPAAPVRALSRSEWVEASMPTWRKVVEPVANGVGNATSEAMMKQLGDMDSSDLSQFGIPDGMLPPGFDISSLRDQMLPMLRQMSSSMFGMQVGQALGALAQETVSGSEVGLPLIEPTGTVLLPSNVAAFAEGLEVDAGEVNLYLAVREAARARLFARVPWLASALIAAVQSYAGDIRIDTEKIEEKLREVDPNDAEAMQEALAGNLFSAEPSEAQQRALTHLETLLALVEGWVDVVTDAATSKHLPHHAALSEAVRRRRATGGPAEKVFASLIGLELRPRRLREAAALWKQLEDESSAEKRDEAWSHPDFAPTAADLDDPDAYIARRTGKVVEEPKRDAMDDELDKLLAQGLAELDADTQSADEQSTPGTEAETSKGQSNRDEVASGKSSDPRFDTTHGDGSASGAADGDTDDASDDDKPSA